MTNARLLYLSPFLAAALFSASCKKKDSDKDKAKEKDEPSDKVTTGSGTDKGTAAKPAEPTKPVGIADATNDPAIVKAAQQLITDCGALLDQSTENSYKPNQKKSYYSCEKWAAFGDASFDQGQATFVNFLDDADVKVRAIGVIGLGKTYDWRNDKALAQRIIDALKREKAPSPIDHNLALRAADISSSLGLDDQLKAIAVDPASSTDVKLAILGWWHGDAAYQAVHELSTTTDPDIINAVVQGYVLHFEDHPEEACTYWVDHLEATNPQAAEYALGHLTGGWSGNTTGDSESEDYISGGGGGPGFSDTKRCAPEQLTKALEFIDKQFQAGKDDSDLTYALAFIAKDKLSPEPVKAKAVEILKAMVEKVGYYPRSTALRALVDSGDPAMKKYAQKFAKDEELASTVEDINKAE